MIARDLIHAAQAAITVSQHRPHMLPALLDDLAEHTDRLLELQGEQAGPLREAGRRIAAYLVSARAAHPAAPEAVPHHLQEVVRQATLVLRLIEILPLLPAPEVPVHWRTPQSTRPRFTVIQGGMN
ncbi:hypothetical protein [Roseomonas xinghualingensis]|uniref:hypothetical protein n=1 Tax=Roseomonas xinghualingensis TaxID=2986475 RepID=UPI0021F17E99|nr:hypothetical protein [Roseomonas sp. SXEYE001]MCV4206885.1 hypothetical protein [Roseomonas sp. SXEYE001]